MAQPVVGAAWRCPGRDDILSSLLSLLPSGRAWQSREGGPRPYHDAAFDPATFDAAAFDTASRPGTILYRFFAAIADVLAFATRRLCDLRLEFWCATVTETREQWLFEYGLPDDCDPFPDLCAKVAALGGATCDYYRTVAERAGWRIECETLIDDCGDGAGLFQAGCSVTGRPVSGATIVLRVYLDDSPAYVWRAETEPYAGIFVAGAALACEPDISPLKCLMERVVHAEIAIQYIPIGGPNG